jgi:hypothetical protein
MNDAPVDNPFGDSNDTGRRKERKSASAVLMGLTGDLELAHTADGETFARVPMNGHLETHEISSGRFANILRYRYYNETGKVIGSEALNAVVNTLKARAENDAPLVEIFVRVGEHIAANGSETIKRYYYDLGTDDWSAAEVDQHGWRVVPSDQVRVWFIRGKGALPLPAPVTGGSIAELRPFLNVRDEDGFKVFVGSSLGALNPRGPFSFLDFAGPEDAGKTTAQRLRRKTCDPNVATSRAVPKTPRALFTRARRTWDQSFDNAPVLSDEMSNAFCMLLTGGADADRALYTDGDDYLLHCMRPGSINGILEIITRPDLLSRTQILALDSIPPHLRKTEAEFWGAFDKAWARIMGALFDAVSYGLGHPVQISGLPRNADYAAWVEACAPALGWKPGEFVEVCRRCAAQNVGAVIDSDPVLVAVRKLMDGIKPGLDGWKQWEGMASELLKKLRHTVGDAEWRTRKMPQAAHTLTGHLRRVANPLAVVGIAVRMQPIEQGTRVTLRAKPPKAPSSKARDTPRKTPPKAPVSQPSPLSPGASPPTAGASPPTAGASQRPASGRRPDTGGRPQEGADAPGSSNEAPEAMQEAPGFGAEAPGFQGEAPGFQGGAPGFGREAPGLTHGKHSIPGASGPSTPYCSNQKEVFSASPPAEGDQPALPVAPASGAARRVRRRF